MAKGNVKESQPFKFCLSYLEKSKLEKWDFGGLNCNNINYMSTKMSKKSFNHIIINSYTSLTQPYPESPCQNDFETSTVSIIIPT